MVLSPIPHLERVAEIKAAVLVALMTRRTFSHAAQDAGIDRKTLFNWRRADPEFDRACEDAQEVATDRLEESIYERALGGDSILSMYLHKGYRPRFRDNVKIDVSGTVLHGHIDLSQMDAGDRQRLLLLAARAGEGEAPTEAEHVDQSIQAPYHEPPS